MKLYSFRYDRDRQKYNSAPSRRPAYTILVPIIIKRNIFINAYINSHTLSTRGRPLFFHIGLNYDSRCHFEYFKWRGDWRETEGRTRRSQWDRSGDRREDEVWTRSEPANKIGGCSEPPVINLNFIFH